MGIESFREAKSPRTSHWLEEAIAVQKGGTEFVPKYELPGTDSIGVIIPSWNCRLKT